MISKKMLRDATSAMVVNPPLHTIFPTSASAELYVAADMRAWMAKDASHLGRDLDLNGVVYRKLDPMFHAWLRYQIRKAYNAKERSELSVSKYQKLRDHFDRIHQWALARFSSKALDDAWRTLLPRGESYRPPSMKLLAERGIPDWHPSVKPLANKEPEFLYPEVGDWPFQKKVSAEALAKVRVVEDRAMALGWTRNQLYQNRDHLRFPFGSNYGLVCFLHRSEQIGKVHENAIEITTSRPGGQTLKFRKMGTSGQSSMDEIQSAKFREYARC